MSNSIIISYSEIFKLDTCPRQYYYRFDKGLKPIEESDAITTGVKGHKLLQIFYTALSAGMTKDQALAVVHVQAKKMMAEEAKTKLKLETVIAPDFSLLTALTLVDKYIKEYEFESNAVLIENRFLLPASELSDDPFLSDVQIGFTPDVVFENTGNFLKVDDYKFVGRAWAKKKINRFQQSKLYQIFLKRMNYNVTRSGILFFNTKTGDVTYQNYVLRPQEEQILIDDFVSGLIAVKRIKIQSEEERAKARRTMNYTACTYCAFELPCSLEAEGKDASKTFKNLYVKSDYDYSK